MCIYDFGDFKFSDSTTGENTTTGYVNRLFVSFCDMSQKAIDITGYGPRPCGVNCITQWTASNTQNATCSTARAIKNYIYIYVPLGARKCSGCNLGADGVGAATCTHTTTGTGFD